MNIRVWRSENYGSIICVVKKYIFHPYPTLQLTINRCKNLLVQYSTCVVCTSVQCVPLLSPLPHVSNTVCWVSEIPHVHSHTHTPTHTWNHVSHWWLAQAANVQIGSSDCPCRDGAENVRLQIFALHFREIVMMFWKFCFSHQLQHFLFRKNFKILRNLSPIFTPSSRPCRTPSSLVGLWWACNMESLTSWVVTCLLTYSPVGFMMGL